MTENQAARALVTATRAMSAGDYVTAETILNHAEANLPTRRRDEWQENIDGRRFDLARMRGAR